jgi:hypothetical protein
VEEAGIYNPIEACPPRSSREPEAPGFRFGCYPRGSTGGGAHRPQAEGRRRRPSRGDGGGQEGVGCWAPAEDPDAAGQDGWPEQGGVVGRHRGRRRRRSRRAWPPSGDRELRGSDQRLDPWSREVWPNSNPRNFRGEIDVFRKISPPKENDILRMGTINNWIVYSSLAGWQPLDDF